MMERFGIGVVMESWRENNIKTEEQGREEKVEDGNSKSDVRECQCLCSCAGKISLGVISVKCNKIRVSPVDITSPPHPPDDVFNNTQLITANKLLRVGNRKLHCQIKRRIRNVTRVQTGENEHRSCLCTECKSRVRELKTTDTHHISRGESGTLTRKSISAFPVVSWRVI
ncbi:hypothetical protein J6590_006595 [Homalodisca vitripennis]|nr:hypothetical protein J6590_006595 [Homalodisca vitripennis]